MLTRSSLDVVVEDAFAPSGKTFRTEPRAYADTG